MNTLFWGLLTTFFLSIFSNSLAAQNYQSAGLRLGYGFAVSYKQFITEQGAVEVHLGTRSRIGTRITNISGAYQHHFPIGAVDGLQWYVGAGATLFLANRDFQGTSNAFGGQGYLGLDYVFEYLPINLSIDWIPNFGLTGFSSGFGADYGGLSVRYVFGD